uniref:Uncharacterized protein n=1 Tax=Denticeps clupeoides TaxID=299321 RepID=A0AAY4DXP8_9TELE
MVQDEITYYDGHPVVVEFARLERATWHRDLSGEEVEDINADISIFIDLHTYKIIKKKKQCTVAMTDHNVRIPVDELDELLQTPEAAFQAAHHKPGTGVLGCCSPTQVLQDDPDNLDQCEDQRPKRQRAHVIPVHSESAGQRALAQRNDKVNAPQEGHNVVDLQVEEVPLVEALGVVVDEHAAG